MTDFLIEQFPEAIEINGDIYDINTDFRVGLQIMADFESSEFDKDECAYLMLKRLYKDLPEDREPEFYQIALQKAIKFLNVGDEDPPSTEGKPRLYSFSQDAKLIYAAFNQTHGIDLQKAQMHWWRFVSLFSDLGADTAFCNLVSLRKRYYDGKTTDYEREYIAEYGREFFLTDHTEQELDESEIEFIKLLPEEDQKRFWKGRNI